MLVVGFRMLEVGGEMPETELGESKRPRDGEPLGRTSRDADQKWTMSKV